MHLSIGSKAKVHDKEDVVKKLFKRSYIQSGVGYEEAMEPCLGKVGKVLALEDDGTIQLTHSIDGEELDYWWPIGALCRPKA